MLHDSEVARTFSGVSAFWLFLLHRSVLGNMCSTKFVLQNRDGQVATFPSHKSRQINRNNNPSHVKSSHD
jgi:hypothetical protein